MTTLRIKSFIASAIVIAIATIAATPFVRRALNQTAHYTYAQTKDSRNQKSSTSDTKANSELTTKPMSKEDVVRVLKEGQEKGYTSKTLPNDPAELDALAQAIHKEMIYQQPIESEMGTETGELQLVIKRRPSGEWDESSDRRLPLSFEGPEWSALFRDVLHAKDRDPFVPGEDLDKWSERQRLQFQESISEYAMLGRIWDTYIDVTYEAGEVPRLRDECLRLRASTQNGVALRGLDKLITACNEALKENLGLSLLCD